MLWLIKLNNNFFYILLIIFDLKYNIKIIFFIFIFLKINSLKKSKVINSKLKICL